VSRVRIIFIFLLVLQAFNAFTQFSIATDGSLLRNLKSQQKFWAFGQTVQLNFYPSYDGKNSIYTWVSYYTTGKFKNNFAATAKDALTTPQQMQYTAHTDLRYRHLSVGWKHYLIGAYNSENIWNIYGYAGFGLLLGKATNSFNKLVDSSLYFIPPPKQGSSAFKRLTFDAGLGTEFPLGTAVFVYTEARTWLPTSHYPSEYLYKSNHNIPAVLAVNVGLRVFIE
jgi:hypothetical protein